jgi:hypothetical protein
MAQGIFFSWEFSSRFYEIHTLADELLKARRATVLSIFNLIFDLPHIIILPQEGYNTLRIVITIRLSTLTIRNKYLTMLHNTRVFYPQYECM